MVAVLIFWFYIWGQGITNIFGAFFLHHVCLLCFIWEHDQENNEGRVRIRDNNEKKGIVVDENQG